MGCLNYNNGIANKEFSFLNFNIIRILKRFLVTIIFLIVAAISFGQSNGDYLSRTQNRDWISTNAWLIYNNGRWINTNTYPTYLNGTITIRAGYTITLNGNITADQLIIENGATLIITTNNTLTIADGTGNDLIVNGTLTINNNASVVVNGQLYNTNTVTNNGTLTFNSGSTYEHARNAGTIPTATWDPNSLCHITGSTGNAPGGYNQTFGNFTWECAQSTYLSLGSATTSIQGNLTIARTGSGNNDFAIDGDMTIGGNLIISGSPSIYRICYNANRTQTVNGNVSIQGGTLLMNSSDDGAGDVGTINVNGDFSITSGILNFGYTGRCTNAGDNGIINLRGNFSHTGGTITEEGNATGCAINFTGSTSQTYSSTGTSGTINYSINNSSGVSLNSNLTVNGTLTFTNGIFTTNSNSLIINNTSASAISGAGGGKYVNGNLSWYIPTGTQSRTFVVGGTYYTPVTIDLSGISTSGYLTGRSDDGDHGSINTSNINPSYSVNRNWTFTNNGVAPVSYNITLNYDVLDNDYPASAGSYILGKLDGSTWTYPNISPTPTSTQILATGLSGFSSFQVGAGAAPPSCTGNPSNQSVCDGVTATFTGFAGSQNEPTVSWEYSTDNGANWNPLTISDPPYVVNNSWVGNPTFTETSTLTINPVSSTLNNYQYRAKFTNNKGDCTTNGATLTVNPLPSAPSGTGGSRCGTGTVDISATPGLGETIDWYDASSGGNLLLSGNANYTTPSISVTTSYYAEARNTTTDCVSATRTEVIAIVYPTPEVTVTNITHAVDSTNGAGGGDICPELNPPDFIPENGSYDSGATYIDYRIDRVHTNGTWLIGYETSGGTILDTKVTGNDISEPPVLDLPFEEVDCKDNDEVYIRFKIDNVENTTINFQFRVLIVIDSETCSKSYSAWYPQTIDPMPAVGSFN